MAQDQRHHQQAREAGDRRVHRRPITTFPPERGDENGPSAGGYASAERALPPAAARFSPVSSSARIVVRRGDGRRLRCGSLAQSAMDLVFARLRRRLGAPAPPDRRSRPAGGASAGAGSATATSASAAAFLRRGARFGLWAPRRGCGLGDRRLFVGRTLDHRRAVGLDDRFGVSAVPAALTPISAAAAAPAARASRRGFVARQLALQLRRQPAPRLRRSAAPRRLRPLAVLGLPPSRRRDRGRRDGAGDVGDPGRSPSCSVGAPRSRFVFVFLVVLFDLAAGLVLVDVLLDRAPARGRGAATGRGPELSTVMRAPSSSRR